MGAADENPAPDPESAALDADDDGDGESSLLLSRCSLIGSSRHRLLWDHRSSASSSSSSSADCKQIHEFSTQYKTPVGTFLNNAMHD